MITWASIILAALRLINLLISWAQRDKQIQEGYDKAISEQAREIFRKTEHAKRVAENINAMSDAEVDAALVALEPASDVSSPINR